MEKIKTFCQICLERCPVKVTVSENKVIKVDGAQCVKGEHAGEMLIEPRRLTKPLRRLGAKGEGRWEEISWDEALDAIAERFSHLRKEYGPQSIASVYGGNLDAKSFAARLFVALFGSKNMWTILVNCSMPTRIAHLATFGTTHYTQDSAADYVNSKCVLLWGSNNTHTRPVAAKAIVKAQRLGAKLIVVDPRPTEEAQRADLWLKVRPGTDCALALGICRVLIDKNLYDKEFVDDWCSGFEKLVLHLKDYGVEEVSRITEIPVDDIVRAAHLLAENTPACCHMRHGVQSMQVNAVQSTRAIGILNALLNTVDKPGGNLFSHELGGFNSRGGELGAIFERITGNSGEWIGGKNYPLLSEAYNGGHPVSGLAAIAKGETKGLFIAGSNLMITEAGTRTLAQNLCNLEMLVVTDIVMTPTAELADIVLPATHFLETESLLTYSTNPAKPRVMASRTVVTPRGDVKDDRQIVLDLAKHLGVNLPWKTVAELNEWQAKPLDISFSDLQNIEQGIRAFKREYFTYREKGFATASGKIELYSSKFEKFGQNPLPTHVESAENAITTPERAVKYPYTLINHKNINFYHSTLRSIEGLRSRTDGPTIEVSATIAQTCEIADGDLIWVETTPHNNPDGHRVRGRARVLQELAPNLVSVEAGWWLSERRDDSGFLEANINTVLSNNGPLDPIGGTPQTKGLLCRIGKAA